MTAPRKPQPIDWKSTLVVLGVCVVRGGNQVALKFALRALAPFWAAVGRMLVGLTTVGLWTRLRSIVLMPGPGERKALFNLGILFTLQIGLMHYGADWTSPAYATVLMNSNPVFANLLAHFVVPEDRLSWRRIAGLAIAFAGICVVFLGRPEARLAPSPIAGNLLLVLSSALVGVRTVYTQQVVQRIQPEKAAFWQMVISLPLFAVLGLFAADGEREPLSWIPVSAVVYQGMIVAGIGFTIWAHLLRRHSPGGLAFFNFTVPFFGVGLSAWLLSEAVTPRLIVGVAAVVAGIALATRRAALASGSQQLGLGTAESELSIRE